MKQHPRLVLFTALVLGWFLDFLFWRQAPGINFAIYVVLCLAGGFLLLRLDGKRIAGRAAWLLPLILFFAAVSFLRAEPLTLFLAVVATLLLMAVLALTFVGGRWLEYSLGDYITGFVRLAGSVIARPFTFQAEAARAASDRRSASAGIWPILRGLLIALPVLLIFGALLASADLIFNRELQSLADLLRLQDLPQYMFRLVYIIVAAYALTGVFIHAAWHSADERLVGEGRQPFGRFLGFVETSTVLGSVILLFAAFVVVQFRYFFGGQANITVEGFTYAEYARRGFGELLAVAFFSLLLILGLGAVTRREGRLQQQLFSGMSVLVVVLVGVMLASAYLRVGLYEAAYGFSRLRTYVHVSLIWLGLLLAAVVLLELAHRERFFATAALAAAVGFAITLSMVDVDAFIVRHNLQSQIAHQELDVQYLASLSTDAVPDLVSAFQDPALAVDRHEAIGAVLACRLKLPVGGGPGDWRSFTVTRWRADTALASIRSELQSYKLVQQDGQSSIVTPGAVSHDCRMFWD